MTDGYIAFVVPSAEAEREKVAPEEWVAYVARREQIVKDSSND